jgi:hypothetical protein
LRCIVRCGIAYVFHLLRIDLLRWADALLLLLLLQCAVHAAA